MSRCTQDPNSNEDGTKGDSVESTDSGTCIPTGKGYSYPPLIFTDPEHAANIPDIDINSVAERYQLSNYVGDYCEDCVTKWLRCICRPESDWDDDQNYTVRTQMDSHLMWKITGIQYHQIGAIRKTSGMVKHLKSYHLLNINTGTYLTKMTLIGMTIFTHRTTGQNLNLRHLLGNHC